MRLIHQLQLLEAALDADDAVRTFDITKALAELLGEPAAVAIAHQLLIERTERRLDAAAAAVAGELARCA